MNISDRKQTDCQPSWRGHIRRVKPYVPGEQPKEQGIVKLNTNENPYPPAPVVCRALEQMDPSCLRLYPDPSCSVLTEGLAAYHGINPDQVFVGVGSDDVLAMAFLTCFNSREPILFPDITYSFYPVWADLFGIPYEQQALDGDFRICAADYKKKNGGVIFPNPNAPTGIAAALSVVEDIIRHNQDVIVIVDEAYVDFGGETALPLLEHYENLLIVRTYSKSRSMAGMRIGYALGSPELIRALHDVKYSYNSYTMSQAALELGALALTDEDYFQTTVKRITDTRAEAVRRLDGLGFHCLDSSANFLFVTHPVYGAQVLFEWLKTQGIYVRYFNSPRISDYLRITIGRDEEMERLYQALERAYENI